MPKMENSMIVKPVEGNSSTVCTHDSATNSMSRGEASMPGFDVIEIGTVWILYK